MRHTLIRWGFEFGASVLVATALISVMISAAFAYMHMANLVTDNLNVLGLSFYRITTVAGKLSGRTVPLGMNLVFLGGIALFFGLLEGRHRLTRR
ncbi:LlsX family protein [Levilactobacillus cerevisiae]|uniref:LlsX family protein n=1 Tax=Levilactobacillus cerevisiae TaxID=1704076 RepID=UPI000F7AAA9E|nr:LlsX family protein [Levilactobacillus cerevisiae]